MSNKDMVNHPSHYTTGSIECIDAMVSAFGAEMVSEYCVCNAFKYLWRHRYKGDSIEDREKAIWYLNKSIELDKEV